MRKKVIESIIIAVIKNEKDMQLCQKKMMYPVIFFALIKDELNELIYDEEHPDIVISVGGDGTMIYSIHRYEHVFK